MNIVEMHKRVRLYLDRQNTPRFRKNFHIDQALNIAQNRYIDYVFDTRKRGTGIQLNQAIRDRLSSLITIANPPLIPTGNILTITPQYNYRYSISLMVSTLSYGMRSCRPVLENEFPVLEDNSFDKPTEEFPVYREIGNTLIIYPNPLPGFNTSELTYLRNPAKVMWSEININAGPNVLVPNNMYYVISGSITHNSINYNQGDIFQAVNTSFTGTGIVNEIVNSDINEQAHEEICMLAAKYLSGEVEDVNKYNFLENELNK